jgi:chromosome segregation ATPase
MKTASESNEKQLAQVLALTTQLEDAQKQIAALSAQVQVLQARCEAAESLKPNESVPDSPKSRRSISASPSTPVDPRKSDAASSSPNPGVHTELFVQLTSVKKRNEELEVGMRRLSSLSPGDMKSNDETQRLKQQNEATAAQLISIQEKISVLEKQLIASQGQNSDLSAQLETQKNEVKSAAELKLQLASTLEQHSELSMQIDSLKAQLSVAADQSSLMNTQLASTQQQNSDFLAQLDSLRQQLVSAQEQNALLESSQQERYSQLEALKKQLASALASAQTDAQLLFSLKKQLSELEEQVKSSNEKLSDSEKHVVSLKEQLASAQSELRASKKEISQASSLKDQLSSAQAKVASAREQIVDFESKLQLQKQQGKRDQQQLQLLQTELRLLEANRATQEVALSALKQVAEVKPSNTSSFIPTAPLLHLLTKPSATSSSEAKASLSGDDSLTCALPDLWWKSHWIDLCQRYESWTRAARNAVS